MNWEAWFTLALIVTLLFALLRNWAPPDVVLVASLIVLVTVGELSESDQLPSAAQAVAGLGNSGLITVAVLFVLVAGLSQTGAMRLVAAPLLGRPISARGALMRLMMPVTLLSAFLNNTPVVAMFMPVVEDICKRSRISPSKLYLPMAYAATFGGVCTLVGTSTNLIVHGLLVEARGEGMRMFDLTWVGVPCAVCAVAFLLAAAPGLLADRTPAINLQADPRQYTVEMVVQANGPLVGRSIEAAGLRHLPGLFLLEIEREGEVLAAVSPRQQMQSNDRLIFVGVVESVVDLQNMRGLIRAAEPAYHLDAPAARRRLIEVVVSNRCPLIGSSIREGKFRSMYDAAVVAVARGAARIPGKIGDIILQPGDTLLLETGDDFVARQRNSSHFFLVSGVGNWQPVRHERAWVALLILLAMVIVVASGRLNLLTAALLAAAAMVATQCCTVDQARQSIDWSLLVMIAASLGIGQAVESSGLANSVSQRMIGLAGGQPWLVLLAVYCVTLLFTELITNNAAAVLVFPVAMSSAAALQVHPMPFVVAVTVAASAGFATPFGYQTNLMVYAAGGYRFSDYLRIGIPLDLIFLVITVGLAPVIWPFS